MRKRALAWACLWALGCATEKPAAQADAAVVDAAKSADAQPAEVAAPETAPIADLGETEPASDAAADLSPTADAQPADALADVAPETADAAAEIAEVAAEVAPDIAADIAGEVSATTGLNVTVTGKVAAKGTLHIFLLPPDALGKPGGPDPSAAQLAASVPDVGLPWAGSVVAPKGKWIVGALLSKGAFNPALALGVAFGCADGKPWLVESDGAQCKPATLALTMTPPEGTLPIAALCGNGGSSTGTVAAFLTPSFAAAPPTTQAGGAHLLDGRWIAGTYWVAGHQDSFISFDFPVGGSPVDLAGWAPQGKGLCSRLFKVGSRLWCSSRRPQIAWGLIDAVSGQAKGFSTVTMPSEFLVDGMVGVQDRVVFAAHGAGLGALQADPPFAPLPLSYTATLSDPWDIALVGNDVLAVADGAGGLKLLAGAGTSPVSLQQVAAVPLPGLTAQLQVVGKQILASSPNGWLHVIDVGNPATPVVQMALQIPFAAWGMAVLPQTGPGIGMVSAGPAIWAFELPKPGGPAQPPLVRGVQRSWHYAMDVDPLGPGAATQVLSAEFGEVRVLDLDLTVPPGPLLFAPKAVFGKPVLVGDTLKFAVNLRNFGTANVLVTQAEWVEDEKTSAVGAAFGAKGLPWSVPANGAFTANVEMPKAKKGVSQHLLKLQTPQGEWVVQLLEVTNLQPGDTLPKMAYQNAQLKTIDVNAALAGKPAVLVVAAHSCPIALACLAAVNTVLGPLAEAGKLNVVGIDPWDKPALAPEVGTLKPKFPMLFSPLTTDDSHAYSALLQDILAQPNNNSAPMPLVYVLNSKGEIVDARQGWEPEVVMDALKAMGVQP